jgi:hypothetical protein
LYWFFIENSDWRIIHFARFLPILGRLENKVERNKNAKINSHCSRNRACVSFLEKQMFWIAPVEPGDMPVAFWFGMPGLVAVTTSSVRDDAATPRSAWWRRSYFLYVSPVIQLR